jgi:hypothetical protein
MVAMPETGCIILLLDSVRSVDVNRRGMRVLLDEAAPIRSLNFPGLPIARTLESARLSIGSNYSGALVDFTAYC